MNVAYYQIVVCSNSESYFAFKSELEVFCSEINELESDQSIVEIPTESASHRFFHFFLNKNSKLLNKTATILKIQIVLPGWILDSISNYKLLDTWDYREFV